MGLEERQEQFTSGGVGGRSLALGVQMRPGVGNGGVSLRKYFCN